MTRIPKRLRVVLALQFQAGATIEYLATLYGYRIVDIEAAIRFEMIRRDEEFKSGSILSQSREGVTMKPICMPCQRFFRPKKNGFYFLEGMPEGNAKAGKAEADKWKPYKLWAGDQWECPDCHATIIVGVGSGQIAEHYQDGFHGKVKSLGADQFQVNDC